MIFVRSGVFVYMMKATRFPGVYKIGISNDPKWRSWSISQTIKGNAQVMFKIELVFAYQIEQTLHLMFKSIRAKNMKGSGKTEWFKPMIPIWIWMIFAAVVLIFFPWIITGENSLYYLAGILFAATVFPAVLFIGFVALLLLIIRIIQECAIVLILFIFFKFLLLELFPGI